RLASSTCALSARPLSCSNFSSDGEVDMRCTIHHTRGLWPRAPPVQSTAMADRKRSLWAWGWQDKFPDDAARKGLAQMVGAFVPSAAPALRALPGDEPSVGEPRVGVPDTLADFATQEPYDRATHTRGRAFADLVAGFAGDYTGAPDLVARPRDTDEVARVLAECDARGWAVVPFGGGTSVVLGV